MKSRKQPQRSRPSLTHYQRLIREATGARLKDLAQIESIMREQIFHSTLDWQTREQLADAARQAHSRLDEDRELYTLDRACRVALFQKMRAEAKLQEHGTPQNRVAVEMADAQYESARSKLFAHLHLQRS